MAETFDIRFARSAGLAGLFEAPANEFRWKGAGQLSIDASGISIAVKRGLLTLFARAQSRRFASSSLIEVYREGNALRLEFSTQESPRTVLPVWVSDRDAAAQIVTLLPTERSVELEDVAPASTGRYRIDRRLVSALIIGVAILGIGVLVLQRNFGKDLAAPLVEAAPSPRLPVENSDVAPAAPATLTDVGPPTPASRTPAARDVPEDRGWRFVEPTQVPVPSMNTPSESAAAVFGTEESESGAGASSSVLSGSAPAGAAATPVKSAHLIAVEQFALFRAESDALHADYLYWRDSLYSGPSLQGRWMAVTARIVNTQEFQGMEFYALREFELAVARNWRDYFSVRAERGDGALAAAHLAFVEELEVRLPDYAP